MEKYCLKQQGFNLYHLYKKLAMCYNERYSYYMIYLIEQDFNE